MARSFSQIGGVMFVDGVPENAPLKLCKDCRYFVYAAAGQCKHPEFTYYVEDIIFGNHVTHNADCGKVRSDAEKCGYHARLWEAK